MLLDYELKKVDHTDYSVRPLCAWCLFVRRLSSRRLCSRSRYIVPQEQGTQDVSLGEGSLW